MLRCALMTSCQQDNRCIEGGVICVAEVLKIDVAAAMRDGHVG